MRVFKDKQYIVFDFEDGKNVKYNLSNGETIGKNNRIVKSLNTQLRGYTIQDIIDSIEDVNYRNFISFVNSEINLSQERHYYGDYKYNNMLVKHITNVGSLLSKVHKYAQYEQYFACGLTNIDINSRSQIRIKCPLNDIPKGLIKLCKQYNLRLNAVLLESYKQIPNLYKVLLDMEFNTITSKEIQDLLAVFGNLYDWKETDTYRDHCYKNTRGLCFYDNYIKIKYLVDNYNYNIKSLLVHLDNLMTYEAIESFSDLCTEFYDYVHMANKLSTKFEKYPRYFLSTHRITCRNYDRLKQVFIEEDFAKQIDLDLEYKIDNYKFIYPKTTQDIKDEAVQQVNCVASYVQKVINGECHVIFLREQDINQPKDEQYKKSLVTVEVRNYKVVQALGKFNRQLTPEERTLINKYNAYLLKIKNKKEIKECVA